MVKYTSLLPIAAVVWGLGILTITPTYAGNSFSVSQRSDREDREEAASFTLRGHEQLAVGEARAALETWQAAYDIYTRLGDRDGITGSLINQSLALQALGRTRRACKILLAALDVTDRDWCEPLPEVEMVLPELAPSSVNAIGLRHLGDVLVSIGHLERSELALTRSLEIAGALNAKPEIEAAWLSLGNTHAAQYRQQRNVFDRTRNSDDFARAIEAVQKALNAYENADENLGASVGIRAKLNLLSLLLNVSSCLEGVPEPFGETFEPTWHDVRDRVSPLRISSLVEILLEAPFSTALTPIEAIYARLNFARSLSQWQQNPQAIEYASDALQQAFDLGNPRAKAYALGILGGLYEQEKNFALALELTQSATAIAQSIRAWDIAYQWQYQLGRIYRQLGELGDGSLNF